MRAFARLLLMLFAVVFCSCSQTRGAKTPIHKDRHMEISLHKVIGPDAAPAAEDYSHPLILKGEDFDYLLSSIRYRGKNLVGWVDAKAVFSAKELYDLTPRLVEAFAKAVPEDEVIFSSKSVKSGVIFRSKRFTNGRMFVKDKKLNCLFANINVRSDVSGVYDGAPRRKYGGSFSKLVTNAWQRLVEDEKGVHYNWIEIDIKQALAERTRLERERKRRAELLREMEEKLRNENDDWQEWDTDKTLEPEQSFEDVPSED